MNKFRLAKIALVLALASAPVHAQIYKVLYNFGSNSGDPTDPRYSGTIAQSRGGFLFSTADDRWTDGLGTAFKITPRGTLTVLHHFNGADGQAPVGGLTLGSDGNYYGTTESGSDSGYGTIFKISAQGNLITLYSFTNGTDGGFPSAAPIQSIDGNFYGTTPGGNGSNGSVYKVTRGGMFTSLHTFTNIDGANPSAPLVRGTDGNFYGTTLNGGTNGLGTIFKINSSGKFAMLFSFDGTAHGANPYAPLIQGSDGNFYGVAAGGGSAGGGVMFKMAPSGRLMVRFITVTTPSGTLKSNKKFLITP